MIKNNDVIQHLMTLTQVLPLLYRKESEIRV